jgi:hypothetical protein
MNIIPKIILKYFTQWNGSQWNKAREYPEINLALRLTLNTAGVIWSVFWQFILETPAGLIQYGR